MWHAVLLVIGRLFRVAVLWLFVACHMTQAKPMAGCATRLLLQLAWVVKLSTAPVCLCLTAGPCRFTP